MNFIKDKIERFSWHILLLTLFFWVVSMLLIKFDLLHKSILTADLALYRNILWNTNFHNMFLYNDWLFFNANYPSYLFEHFSPTLILFAPLYKLFPNASTLLVIQVLMLALTAPLIFILAKKVLKNNFVSLVLALAYLFHPAVIAPTIDGVSGFRHDAFMPFLIVAAAIFLYEKKVFPYLIALILLLGLKENLPLIGILLGVGLVFKKEYRNIGILTFILSVIFLFVALYLLPYIFNVHNRVASGVVHDFLTLNFSILDNLWEFKKWLVLLFFIPAIFAPEIMLLTGPDLLMFYVTRDSPLDNNGLTPVTIFVIAAIFGSARLLNYQKFKNIVTPKWGSRILITASSALVLAYMFFGFFLYKRHLRIEGYFSNLRPANQKFLVQAESLIAKESFLSVTSDMMVNFANRHHLLWPNQRVDQADYLLINETARQSFPYDAEMIDKTYKLCAQGKIKVILRQEPLTLYERSGLNK